LEYDSEPTFEQAEKDFLREHIFGLSEDEEIELTDGLDLGDGMTAVSLQSIHKLNQAECEFLRKVGL